MKITVIILNCITIGCLLLVACPPNSQNTTTETTNMGTSSSFTSTIDDPTIPTSTNITSGSLESTSEFTAGLTLGSDSFVTTFETTSTTLNDTFNDTSTGDIITSMGVTETTGDNKGSVVFVTSNSFNGDFSNISPDEQCQNAAEKGKLIGDYRAWISFTNETAFDRVSQIPGQLVRLDGQIFSQSINDLLIGNIINPLNIDENINVHNTEVWTASNPEGSLTIKNNCLDWSDSKSVGFYGKSDLISGEWTMFGTISGCNSQKALYCFEVEKQAN